MSSSNPIAQVGIDSVELTCTPDTSDSITSYEWYKDGVKIDAATAQKYTLPGNAKTDSGSYQCKVVTTIASEISDAIIVTFYCK